MTHTVFELPHIFVLFPPGGSGNFVSSVIRGIIYKDLRNISISATGNAHAFSNSASEYDAEFSCGMIANLPHFNTREEKITFYKNIISKKYSNISRPIVTWTHDYSNIEIYKILFPNSKVIAITQISRRERVIQLILQNLKNRMDPAGFVFLKDDIFKNRWERPCKSWLWKLLWPGSEDLIEEILSNKLDPKYFDLVLFVTIIKDLKIFNLDILNDCSNDYSDFSLVSRYDLDNKYSKFLDNLSYKTNNNNVVFCLGHHNSHYYNQTTNLIAFDTIMNNDGDQFASAIEKLIERNLDSSEINYIRESLQCYHSKQPKLLLDDYVEYIKDLKQSAMKIIDNLRYEHGK